MKYGNLVERDHGAPAEDAARFHTTRWTIVVRAALGQMQWRQSVLAGLCRLYWCALYIFGRRRGHSPSDINKEIHAFCEALIASGGRLVTSVRNPNAPARAVAMNSLEQWNSVRS